ncbi:UDP-N-acetylmuramoylalanyl-D-glutamate-2, 6-diaminopimelate ligase [Legionella beliardensis]|uniref:UDP-N-acetylmuramoyl-L-alanyl-D-glutamate--2,6-diaminopimelate ligase n=1 Tax=Legionella beliardensis TaxID=91822 RepID=A0A378HZS3_9GAMM|nr:UDP-N-acetylmuramoyl-L-alanyl-D-glutamate--2,6-diaminopimelate ligase [Legionella beliardensis]STX28233.1 UDP-N-acetylmuramoylalanyl-D-glutamate-2, 6-diaminopimelate ligase [Legionella beliardensis]
MKLDTLLKPWVKNNVPELDILELHNDSRKIAQGSLFCAYPGTATDGRLYIEQAIKAGAVAILYDSINFATPTSSTSAKFIALPNLAEHLAAIASRFYEEPSKKLHTTGITGTNGKTTIAYQLAQAHQRLGEKAAYIGTIGQGNVTALQPLNNTTPDGLCLQSLFNEYVLENIKHVCMEVSSHALAQQRVDAINFEQAIFTNLTLDHLDYHQTMEAYATAKAKLFTYPSLKSAIVNYDDAYSERMLINLPPSCKLITYGLQKGSDIQAIDWQVTMKGTTLHVASALGNAELSINALGYFNIYNALAVFSSLLAWEYPLEQVVETMKQLAPAPGRMEIVTQNPCVVVDYAHTPDALENVLKTLTHVKEGRLITVFGCGGDRDKSKRPMMGDIATRYADIAIVTSDNPRTEDPDEIICEIKQGIVATTTPIHHITDRKAAIEKAISMAGSKDIVLIAGKGHEDYQQIGQVKYPFSDQAIVRELVGSLCKVSEI